MPRFAYSKENELREQAQSRFSEEEKRVRGLGYSSYEEYNFKRSKIEKTKARKPPNKK